MPVRKELKFKIFDSYVEIYISSPTYGNKIAYVDIEDWGKVKTRNWWVLRSSKTFYCASYDHGTGCRRYLLHWLIMGAKGGDHVNHNGLDNRRDNLREATHRQNMCNKTINVRNKTGYRGVYYDSYGRSKGYRAAIKVNGKTLSGQRFKNVLLAAYQYNVLSSYYYGEFAALNELSAKEMKQIMADPKFGIANTIKKAA